MADLGPAPSTALPASRHRSLPPLLPIALSGGAWLVLALMLMDEGASSARLMLGPLAAPFEDERLRAILASLCRADVPGTSWWLLFADHLAMWSAMVLAMMLPCALPAWRTRRCGDGGFAGHGFMLGYGAAWAGFALVASGIAAAAQLATPERDFTAALLLLAGLHQLGPHKAAAVAALRGYPISIAQPAAAAAQHGLAYGLHSLRSDAVPMGLMLLTGSMNLLAMFALTALMLLEKTSGGRFVARTSGVTLIALGATLWAAGAPA